MLNLKVFLELNALNLLISEFILGCFARVEAAIPITHTIVELAIVVVAVLEPYPAYTIQNTIIEIANEHLLGPKEDTITVGTVFSAVEPSEVTQVVQLQCWKFRI